MPIASHAPALTTVRDATLNWLVDHVDLFDLASAKDAAALRQRLKPFVELAYVLSGLVTRNTEHVPQIATLTNALLAHAHEYDWEGAALLDPRGAVAILTLASLFANARRTPNPFADLAERIVSTKALDFELVPYRRMELWRLLARAGFHDVLSADFSQLFQSCNVVHMPVPRYSTADAYALTHLIFYVTDDGNGPLPPTGLAKNQYEHLLWLAQTWSTIARIDGNLDLAGEFTACLSFLGSKEPELTASMFEFAARHVNPNGSISPAVTTQQSASDDEFSFNFHSTMVWAFAGTAHTTEPGAS